MPGMRSEEIYPDDHLVKISDGDLRSTLGLGLGAVHRFRTAALEFWKLQVQQHLAAPAESHARNAQTSNLPGPSSVGQKRKTPEDSNDWVVVPYKRKYPDGGEKRIHFRHFKDGRTPTYDDGTSVFNHPDNSGELKDQYIEEQVKLHEEGVQDFVMVGEGGYWMRIPPTQGDFLNPLTDNASVYMDGE
jgi:hypothetical protein